MCPELDTGFEPSPPYEATHTVEVMGEEVQVCEGCKNEIKDSVLGGYAGER
jgi:hypothetical protein